MQYEMTPGPPFDYTTPFNPDPFRRGQWAVFKHTLKKHFVQLSLAVIIFPLVALLGKTASIDSAQTNPFLSSLLNFFIQTGFILIFVYMLIYAGMAFNFSKLLTKQVQDFTDKTFHTTISETALTIRNPVTHSEKTYPLNTITLVKTHPDFLILKHEHEYLYIGTKALHENQAFEFFVSNVSPQ
ncbi:hypothetical protein C0431_09135 [bacterium]|nr:hypothetical protein [bacterium]